MENHIISIGEAIVAALWLYCGILAVLAVFVLLLMWQQDRRRWRNIDRRIKRRYPLPDLKPRSQLMRDYKPPFKWRTNKWKGK